MKSHLIIILMCMVSSAIGSLFTLSMQQANADDTETIPKHIDAHEFRLVDANGQIRARLGFTTRDGIQNPYMFMQDFGGKTIMSVAIDNDGMPYIRMNHPEHSPLALRQRGGADRRVRPDSEPSDQRIRQTDD